MPAATFAFALGIACLLQFSALPSVAWLGLFFPCLWLSRYFYPARWGCFFVLGLGWAMLRLAGDIEPGLDAAIKRHDVYVAGTVAAMPEVFGDRARFRFRAERLWLAQDGGRALSFDGPVNLRLNWYRPQTLPAPGEYRQFKTRLRRPYNFMNPGGFDYETWLFRKDIQLTGYVRQAAPAADRDTTQPLRGALAERLRHAVAERLRALPGPAPSGLARALSIGDRSGLDGIERELLLRTGTGHLIAISGLHLSMIALVVYFLARFVLRRLNFLTDRLAAPVLAAALAFAAALFYAALAGFTLPTQRALIMLAAVFVALLHGRKIALQNVIAGAVLCVLLLDPMAVIAADFCLSFMAVVCILYLTRYRFGQDRAMLKWLKLQLALSVALLPLLAFWFKQVPLYSAAANLVAIPLAGFIIIPLLLAALILLFLAPPGAVYLYALADRAGALFWDYLALLSERAGAVLPVAGPNLLTLAAAMAGMFILFMPRGLPGRYLGVLWLLPLFFPLLSRPAKGAFELVLLDVGQGLAAVVRTRDHALLYDTGARFSERFNMGEAVIVPYLRYAGVDRLSALVVSHGDNDHIGGARAVLESLPVARVISSVPEKLPGGRAEGCHAGQGWVWNEVSFAVLHPPPAGGFSGNNGSCVLRVSSRYGSVLLTGDIEAEAERFISQNTAHNLQADVLVVPHHGSDTSSTPEFIDRVAPAHALVAAGYRNRYGLPRPAVINDYHARGIETRVTYLTGAIQARVTEDGIRLNNYREQHRRFWHYQP